VIGGKAQCMQTIHYSSKSDASSKADPGEGSAFYDRNN
jgi:hypothetical protein